MSVDSWVIPYVVVIVAACVCYAVIEVLEWRAKRRLKAELERAKDLDRRALELEGEAMLRGEPGCRFPAVTPPGVPLRAKVYRRGDIEAMLAADMVAKMGLRNGEFRYHVIYMMQSDGTFLGARMELARKARKTGRSGGR